MGAMWAGGELRAAGLTKGFRMALGFTIRLWLLGRTMGCYE